jgi:hypothetical protein
MFSVKKKVQGRSSVKDCYYSHHSLPLLDTDRIVMTSQTFCSRKQRELEMNGTHQLLIDTDVLFGVKINIMKKTQTLLAVVFHADGITLCL